ncbi:uroporphyrinogen decarboxylase [candidate division KSB3 bacterium]|uniref:Uroporphyrinogen decarboxylase n=1 Tax=candidate division KSB3 bacterium TaxID=2044937 RepID=A0A9D5JTP6_9BACT|nr:uroporphyrinogen decarboxylase [candidate division KSB3 bacterium]MBD3323914.1 uroporphyrinogen decarboxylase [candidate division KSB3 bacterium]
MTRRERVIEALHHRETDIVPYQINFTQEEHDNVARYVGDPNFEEHIGVHIDLATFNAGFTTEDPDKPGYFTDDFGVCWNKTGVDKDIGVVDEILLKEPDLSTYRFPELPVESLHRMYRDLMQNGHDTFKVGRISLSMFERAWSLRGMQNLLMDMILHPAFVEALLEAICEFNLQILNLALTYDIDGVYFGDDWGQQKGLIMGAPYWRKFLKPQMAKMYARVKSAGKTVIQHSCGDNREILPDLLDIGLDLYQTVQPEIYDLPTLKREYGQDLAFWGAISTQRLLPFATPEEVKHETVKIMKILGEQGGYIVGPTHWVPGDVPPENILALIDVFQNQAQYIHA